MNEYAIIMCLLPAIAACIAMGFLFSTAVSGISKNPEATNQISGATLLGAAFIESIVLLSVGLGFAMMFGLGSHKNEDNQFVTEQVQNAK